MIDLTDFKTWLSIHVGKKTTRNHITNMEAFFRKGYEFNQEHINKYLASKSDVWCAGMFNSFFASAKKYSTFSKISIELPEQKKIDKRKARPYLKEEQINEIIDKIHLLFTDAQKAKCVLSLMLGSGMRPKELYTLKRANIDLQERKIFLEKTKTVVSRTIFIPPDLISDINVFFAREPEVNNAFNLGEKTIAYYCQKIKEYLNIQVTPYMLRHSYSHSFLKKANNNIVALSNLLGHTNLETTKIYCNIDEKELHDIYDKAFQKKRRKK